MRWQTGIWSLCCRRSWRAVNAFSLFSQAPKHSQPKLVCSVCLYRWILCIILFHTKIQLSFAYVLFYILNPLTPAWNTCADMQDLHKKHSPVSPLCPAPLNRWTVFDLQRGLDFSTSDVCDLCLVTGVEKKFPPSTKFKARGESCAAAAEMKAGRTVNWLKYVTCYF